MQSFEYTITDPVGIHARPAGLLVKEIKSHPGITVNVTRDDQTANALKLMSLMNLGIRLGDTITVSVEGEGEEYVAAALEEFFKAHF